MKKKYQGPITKVVLIESGTILTGSTGATIPSAGWGRAKGRNEDYDEEDD